MMKPEAQRIAIAEACGTLQWSYALPQKCVAASVPDYLNDLNAMHEAEKVLSPANQPARGESQWSEYLGWLGFCGENKTREVYGCVTATAAQRAEAFLRTIGKWEGE
jgi:hypothetical protein